MNDICCKDIENVFAIFLEIKQNKKIDLKKEEIILNFCSNLTKNIKIKPLNKGYDVAYTEEDFEYVAINVQPCLISFHRIIEEIIVLNEFCFFNLNFLKILISDSIFVSQYLNPSRFWSNEECSSVSQRIIDSLMKLLHCNNLTELFVGIIDEDGRKKVFPNGFLKLYLEEFSQIFTKSSWKEYPSYKDVYNWLLFNIQAPHLSEFVVYFLPPALFILDDWEQENKLFGVKALQHILDNTPGSELRWHGRADVIFEVLKHNLYSREPKVLEYAYPAAVLAASILEKDPKYSSTMKKKFYDTLMDHLLSQMNYEQQLALRTIYVNTLKLLVKSMEIFAIKWADVILEVCAGYLETYEGELAQDRLTVLETLQHFITCCWPRIKFHAETIVKMVLQLTYEINLDNFELKNKDVILQQCKKIFSLLYAACPETVQVLCEGLSHLEVDYMEDILYVISDIKNI